MDLKGKRIGYAPCTPSFSAPSDRRRFVYYAKKHDIPFEIALPSKDYDIVVLNQRADLSIWYRYPKGKTKIIYDAIDSYLAIPKKNPKAKLRGMFKFLSGQSQFLELSYHRSIQKMCQRADAVICSTKEQKQLIMPFCKNIHIILDFHGNDVFTIKENYSRSDTFHFVWEGLASSGIPMRILRKILEPIISQNKIALHLITDLVYYRYGNLYFKRHTCDDVKKHFGRLAKNIYIYQWNPLVLSEVATACDMALIPIDLNDDFQRSKPENKLLLFWRMGIPTITSATPAYMRAMKQVGLSMTCSTLSEWHTIINKYMNDKSTREQAGRLGRSFVESNYGEDQILQQWDKVFASL